MVEVEISPEVDSSPIGGQSIFAGNYTTDRVLNFFQIPHKKENNNISNRKGAYLP